jgi:predicted nucleotidyltransferase
MKKVYAIKKILAQHKKDLNNEFAVKQIGIFGSYVRNEQTAKSDADILVEFDRPVGLFKFMELEEYLAKLLKTKVDLVSKNALKPYMGRHILNEVVYI